MSTTTVNDAALHTEAVRPQPARPQHYPSSRLEARTQLPADRPTVSVVEISPEQQSISVTLPLTERKLYTLTKRVVDIVFSLFALILLSPIFLVAALAIRINDRGPAIFWQTRVGRNGRTFTCFKFRSMVVHAEKLQQSLSACNHHSDPRTFKINNDPRITKTGRFLRRFSIDELPQFVNVLMGHMSLVGPRPPVPKEVALYSEDDKIRLLVKPGLTCLWQISGRSRLAFPEQVKLDVEYIQQRGVIFDLWIILRTIPAIISGDGAA